MAITWKKLAYEDDVITKAFMAAKGDILYASANGVPAVLAIGADNHVLTVATDIPDWEAGGGGAALSSKVITGTRDLAAATGDVAYTGVGFQPTAVIALSYKASVQWQCGSWGLSDSVKACGCLLLYAYRNIDGGAYLIGQSATSALPGTTGQTAIVKSYDADGFTLTWTKNGVPTGTAVLYFLCLK